MLSEGSSIIRMIWQTISSSLNYRIFVNEFRHFTHMTSLIKKQKQQHSHFEFPIVCVCVRAHTKISRSNVRALVNVVYLNCVIIIVLIAICALWFCLIYEPEQHGYSGHFGCERWKVFCTYLGINDRWLDEIQMHPLSMMLRQNDSCQ